MKTRQHAKQLRRVQRSRATIFGTSKKPRLSVKRSNEHIEGQIIDDAAGKTLCACHDREVGVQKATKEMSRKVAIAYAAGKRLAEKAKKNGISAVVFDRRGSRFHGRIKSFAQGARDGGLTF